MGLIIETIQELRISANLLVGILRPTRITKRVHLRTYQIQAKPQDTFFCVIPPFQLRLGVKIDNNKA